MLALLLALFLVPSASAIPYTWQFSAALPLGGTVEGSWTLEEQVGAVNVRHLSGNQTFAVQDWHLTLTPSPAILPYLPQPIFFSSSNSTAEFCVGNCLFGGGQTETFRLSDGINALQLTWQGGTFGTWGLFMSNGSELTTPRYLIGLSQGQVNPVRVPEPSSLWLLILGGTGIILALWRKIV